MQVGVEAQWNKVKEAHAVHVSVLQILPVSLEISTFPTQVISQTLIIIFRFLNQILLHLSFKCTAFIYSLQEKVGAMANEW